MHLIYMYMYMYLNQGSVSTTVFCVYVYRYASILYIGVHVHMYVLQLRDTYTVLSLCDVYNICSSWEQWACGTTYCLGWKGKCLEGCRGRGG